MPDRFGHRLPHAGGAAEHAVQPGLRDHLDDGAYAATGFTDHHRDRAVEFDLRRRVRLVAEFVLEALDAKDVARAIGQHTG